MSFFNCATVSAVDLISFALVGPKFVPPVDVGSYPLPAADGRPWKYCGFVQSCPMIDDPMTLPFTVTSDPFACLGKISSAAPVMAIG